jgi:hypothetical protein
MSHDFPWDRSANVIEIEPRDGRFASAVLRQEAGNYLAVVSSASEARRLEERHPELRGHLAVADCRRSLRRNNADVLVLNGASRLSTGYWRAIRHAEWIAVPLTLHPLTGGAWAAGMVRWMRRRLDPARLVEVDGASRRLLVWRNRRRSGGADARRYIPHRFGVEKFLRTLTSKDVPHAVLRWFESLPAVAAGEDLDLLVADEQLTFVRQLLSSGPGLQPIDVYSVTGLPGSDFRRLPYYPPALAREILDTSRLHRDVCRVPDAERHFLSLAYHALYHKGNDSGLPVAEGVAAKRRTDHDYAAHLAQLGAAADYDGPVTLDDLDDHLARRGWRPSHDMMARLAPRNAWLRTKLGRESSAGDDGLAVFLLREEAMKRGGLDRACDFLKRRGFEIAHAGVLDASAAALATSLIRGGNWGRGPWPASGGPPRAVIVTRDSAPIKLNRRQRKKYPFAVNARVFCKDELRDEFNQGVAEADQCNVIHSSDNGREAFEYLQTIYAGRDEWLATIAQPQKLRGASPDVVADVTKSGRRARVEIVWHEGRLVVKKTFKAEMLRFLEREVEFLSALSGKCRYVPPLIARGDSWLMIPYYDDVLRYRRSSGQLLPVAVAQEAMAALREVFEAGYALIDASIDNLLVDRREGLKLFDFEFAHRYEAQPPSFERGFDIIGCPSDFAGDLPIQGGNSYGRNWQPYIGLNLKSLLHDNPGQQQVKRAAYVALHLHRFLPRRLRSVAQGGRIERPSLELATLSAPPAGESPSRSAHRRAA